MTIQIDFALLDCNLNLGFGNCLQIDGQLAIRCQAVDVMLPMA